MEKISIYDLAELAGLSPMTVSRALRPGTPVAKDTRKRVRDLARKHGYQPNPVGVALQARTTLEVGISYETLVRGEFAAIIGELNLRLSKVGYYMKVLEPRPKPLTLRDIKQLMPRRPQSLLMMNLASEGVVGWLEKREIPTVWLLERPTTDAGRVIFFGSEDYHGARLLLDHLYHLGHRRIAHLCAEETTFGTVQRDRAYRDFTSEHGLPLILEPTSFQPDGGAKSADRVMAHTPRPTALLCANDNAAAGAMFRIQEMGLRIPADVSVVGFGDIPGTHYDYLYPGLTTVRHQYHRLGLQAVDALVDLMLGKPVPPGDFLLPSELVIRGTCGPAKRTK